MCDRAGRLLYYFAVGTMRIAELRDVCRQHYQGLFVPEADVRCGLFSWERDLFGRFIRAGDRVLVIGSGTGRDLLVLVQQGHRVTGVEPAVTASAIARWVLVASGLDADLIDGYFEDAPLDGPFDVVIFSFYCYSYIVESRRRTDALRKAESLLAPGGRILISHPRKVPRPHPMLTRVAAVAARISRSDWHPERGDRLDAVGAGPFFQHVFRPGEVGIEAAAAGLRVVYRRDEPDEPVWALERATV